MRYGDGLSVNGNFSLAPGNVREALAQAGIRPDMADPKALGLVSAALKLDLTPDQAAVTGLDLGLAAAVLSSFYDAPLPEGAAFWGELDLNGHVRPVANHDTRLKQSARLGYGPLLHSGTVKTLEDLRRMLFGKGQG